MSLGIPLYLEGMLALQNDYHCCYVYSKLSLDKYITYLYIYTGMHISCSGIIVYSSKLSMLQLNKNSRNRPKYHFWPRLIENCHSEKNNHPDHHPHLHCPALVTHGHLTASLFYYFSIHCLLQQSSQHPIQVCKGILMGVL